VRPGSGKVVDIEREVELGGPIHSKGVQILSGFLAGGYERDKPMSLFASLVFEQSYAGVEGDSASFAELFALMSALADIPLRQDLAVTGSVNQRGEVQAIGGVNEKIEGFFDICKARGLTGTQGVLIPKSNVQHLMLRQDVIDACAAGAFAVYPIVTVDEGIALLTGRAAGQRGSDDTYPADSINGLIESRLRSFARTQELARRASLHEQDDTDFKRMILPLPHSREDYAAVGTIAELAGLLSVDLVGIYVEDSSIRGLAELPHAREFRGGRWEPLSAEQLAQDVAFAAREAERLFLEYAGRYGPAPSFSLAVANPREAGAEDIIVVIEPVNAIERATYQFHEWLEAAFRSASSILLVPSHASGFLGRSS
jgi:hypothetical protein